MIFIRKEVENIYYFISQVYELMLCQVAKKVGSSFEIKIVQVRSSLEKIFGFGS